MTLSIELEEIRDVLSTTGSLRAAERFFRSNGIDVSARTLARRLQDETDYTVDEVPERFNVDTLIQQRIEKFRQFQASYEASKTRTVRLRSNDPIGLGFLGDPHLDNEGTNLEKLLRHAELFNGKQPGLYVGLLGDVTDNWVGRLQAIYAESSINSAETIALTEWFLKKVNWLFAIHGNHDCHVYATECLTKRGWLFYDDLRDDDEVFGFNPDTGCGEWQPILTKFSRENAEPLVHIENQHVAATVTPNHRVLRSPHKNSSRWEYILAKNVQVTRYHTIKTSAVTDRPDAPIYDDELRLAGWLLTDAGRNPAGAWTIYQSKPETVDEIRDLLIRLNIEFTETHRTRDIRLICGRELKNPSLPAYEFYIKALGSDYSDSLIPDRTVLPDWVHTLSARQFDILLDTIVAADGCWDGAYPEHKYAAVVHKAKPFLDSLQAAAVTFGWRTLLSVARDHDWRLNLTRKETSTITTSDSVSEVPAEPRVWCLSVPLTNFMVRLNGKAHFTGNCWNKQVPLLDYLLGTQTDITAKHEQRVKLVFPNGREVLIHARHKFPGTSQWTKQFGQIKAAMLGGDADIYVGGDKHVSGYSNGWHDAQKRMWHAIQVASYKEIDEYPVELGLQSADLYQCPVAVIDPRTPNPLNFIRWEFDPEEGAKRLAWVRSRN
jgi:hypothetical protein